MLKIIKKAVISIIDSLSGQTKKNRAKEAKIKKFKAQEKEILRIFKKATDYSKKNPTKKKAVFRSGRVISEKTWDNKVISSLNLLDIDKIKYEAPVLPEQARISMEERRRNKNNKIRQEQFVALLKTPIYKEALNQLETARLKMEDDFEKNSVKSPGVVVAEVLLSDVKDSRIDKGAITVTASLSTNSIF